ncbi:hypothetical protein VP1G_02371 [Cytospora mali]|uniref:HAUS augmin-like complex subunit 6 N-terminal domain-containing protein n=1 Tax=Cytospora mali TaxID=578113 RepID=A0A194UTD5_CYTMA|nr:hypothetical protein VP1G_02371 [Valsa mali var. pyri (nom. inval.)]
MAATQNSLLSRTRSTRLNAANSTKSIATSATDGPALPAKHSTLLTTASNVSIFLTNLRLLDLDLLPDWPDINPLTFTNKDLAQGQKKRIQSVEWALYQLFWLWDPEEARNKLQPFFPPLEQVQSLNLRAALLRCLEQAKKNGVLGRDAILRKTMLDECKGERLEEILAVFSSAVLKKLVAEEQLNNNNRDPIAAQTLALENRGYSGERAELNALILAHKVSLMRKLTQKKAAKVQYNDFAQLLDLKERGIARRREEIRLGASQSKNSKLSEDAKLDIRRVVRNNWSGNERWMDTLLYGDAKSTKDGLLTAPFDRVWRRVRSNRLSELEDKSGGLLVQLDSRVRAQQERLGKWQTFRKEMFGNEVDEAHNKEGENLIRQKGFDLGLGAHESLVPGRGSPRKLTGIKGLGLEGEYGRLLGDLNTELKSIGRGLSGRATGQLRRREQPLKDSTQSSSSEKAAEEPVSELSELEEELAKAYVPLPSRPLQASSQQFPDKEIDSETTLKRPQRLERPRLPQPLKTMHAFKLKSKPTEISLTESPKPASPPRPKVPSPRHSPIQDYDDIPPSPDRSPTRSPQQYTSSSPARSPPRELPRLTESPEPMPPSPTQQQADQILASMNAASPSPIKQHRPRHTLSLAERTRLSLVRTLSTEEENELAMGTLMPLRRRHTTSRSPTKKSKPSTPITIPEDASLADTEDDSKVAAEGEENDLVARTRKSMANFEATQQRVRLERQRSERRESRKQSLTNKSGEIARQSYFSDAADEETGGEGNSTMMLEELLAKEAEGIDYDAVFKSRPKIKASPPGTPVRDHFDGE